MYRVWNNAMSTINTKSVYQVDHGNSLVLSERVLYHYNIVMYVPTYIAWRVIETTSDKYLAFISEVSSLLAKHSFQRYGSKYYSSLWFSSISPAGIECALKRFEDERRSAPTNRLRLNGRVTIVPLVVIP